jgi:hypothetical protein
MTILALVEAKSHSIAIPCLNGMPPCLQSLIHAPYGSPRWLP